MTRPDVDRKDSIEAAYRQREVERAEERSQAAAVSEAKEPRAQYIRRMREAAAQAGEDVKPGADASRWAVVLSAKRVIKGSTMRHAQVLVADLVDLTLSEPLPTPRRVIEARNAASAREVVAMAAKIAGQHPAFSIDDWHDVTRRALRKTAGVLAEQSQ